MAGFDPNLYRYVGGNPVSYVDPGGDQWANVAGAVAGCIGGFGGSLFEQGVNQATSGNPCPPSIDLRYAIAACVSLGAAGFLHPPRGFYALSVFVVTALYGGAITGGIESYW